MLKPTDIYVDLGTASTLIYAKNQGLLLNEPTMLVSTGSKKKDLVMGKNAKLMLGKTPPKLSVIRPLKEGVIDDYQSTSEMLYAFLKLVRNQMIWTRSRMLISLPCKVSEHEKRSVKEVGYDMGAGIVELLHEPIAAAVGANLPILENRGSMLIDIGGGTTEIAIISGGSIIASEAVRVGGNDIDRAIIQWLQFQHHFYIGEQTAEQLKMAVATATLHLPLQKVIKVGGLDLLSGLPVKKAIDSVMIYPAVDSILHKITDAIQKTFENCPPEIAGDIAESGVVVAGGGALIPGLKGYLEEQIGVSVRIADNPLYSVAAGGARILENRKLYDSIECP